MLEVASGTGQHAKHFAQHLPGVTVQPSEVDESLFDSIKGYAQQVDQGNMREPIKIDVEQGPWNVPDSYYDYILNVNMFHVSSYSCCVSFFKFASQVKSYIILSFITSLLMRTLSTYLKFGRILLIL